MMTQTPGQQAIPTTDQDHPFPERYAARWTMVKTVPEDPHEYVVRRSLSADGKAEYDEFVAFIRAHGERRLWAWSETARPRPYWYWRQDGYEFWEAPAGLVNRKPVGQVRKVATCPTCGTTPVPSSLGKVQDHPDCEYRGEAILSDP